MSRHLLLPLFLALLLAISVQLCGAQCTATVPFGGFINSYPNTSCPATSGYAFNTVMGVAVDLLGNIYVADWQTTDNGGIGRVVVLSPDGVFLNAFPNTSSDATDSYTFNYVGGVAVDSDFNIYVADIGGGSGAPGRVVVLASDGSYITAYGDSDSVVGVALDSADDVYLVIQHLGFGYDGRVVKYSSTGGYIIQYPTSRAYRFPLPVGVAVDAQFNVYVADTYTSDNGGVGRVVVLLPDGTFVKQYPDASNPDTADYSFADIGGVALDALGNIYVNDQCAGDNGGCGRVVVLANNGSFITAFPEPDTDTSDYDFSGLLGLTLDSQGTIYVADSGADDNGGTGRVVVLGSMIPAVRCPGVSCASVFSSSGVSSSVVSSSVVSSSALSSSPVSSSAVSSSAVSSSAASSSAVSSSVPSSSAVSSSALSSSIASSSAVSSSAVSSSPASSSTFSSSPLSSSAVSSSLVSSSAASSSAVSSSAISSSLLSSSEVSSSAGSSSGVSSSLASSSDVSSSALSSSASPSSSPVSSSAAPSSSAVSSSGVSSSPVSSSAVSSSAVSSSAVSSSAASSSGVSSSAVPSSSAASSSAVSSSARSSSVFSSSPVSSSALSSSPVSSSAASSSAVSSSPLSSSVVSSSALSSSIASSSVASSSRASSSLASSSRASSSVFSSSKISSSAPPSSSPHSSSLSSHPSSSSSSSSPLSSFVNPCCYTFTSPTLPSLTLPKPQPNSPGDVVVNQGNPITPVINGESCNGNVLQYWDVKTQRWNGSYVDSNGVLQTSITNIYATGTNIQVSTIQSSQAALAEVLINTVSMLNITCNNGVKQCILLQFGRASNMGTNVTTNCAADWYR